MINGDVNEFVNHMYYGDELTFLYKNRKLFFQGLTDDKFRYLELVQWEPEVKTDEEFFIWKTKCDLSKPYPVKEFLEAKIFDGKSFWEVEQEITWID